MLSLWMSLWKAEEKITTLGSHRRSCRFRCRRRAASRAFHWTVWRQTPRSWSSPANQDLALQTVPLFQRVHLYLTAPEYIQMTITYLLRDTEFHLSCFHNSDLKLCRSLRQTRSGNMHQCHSWNMISLLLHILGVKPQIELERKK